MMYATAHLGAVFVPLNVRWSTEELAHAICDSEASLLGFDVEFRSTISAVFATPAHGRRQSLPPQVRAVIQFPAEQGSPYSSDGLTGVVLHHHSEIMLSGQAILAAGKVGADDDMAHGVGDDLCTLVFTSGSEGRPKAVMLSHTNQVVQALEKIAQVNYSRDSISIDSSNFTDLATTDVYWYTIHESSSASIHRQ